MILMFYLHRRKSKDWPFLKCPLGLKSVWIIPETGNFAYSDFIL